MLSERHELNKIALLELKKDVEETREFSSYFLKWQIFIICKMRFTIPKRGH